MNIVESCVRDRLRRASVVWAGTVNRSTAPSVDLTGGRFRSTGSSSSGRSASCSTQ